MACPSSLLPQHIIAPLVRRIAHVCCHPAAIAVYVPLGAVAFPLLLLPQQLIDPSVRIAHECSQPALTAV